MPPAVVRDPLGDHEFLNVTKARTRLIPPLLEAAGLSDVPYNRYYEIAQHMLPEEIHPEVMRHVGRDLPGVPSRALNVHEVPEPILNSPYEEPGAHWRISEHEPPEKRHGRRPASYFYRRPQRDSASNPEGVGTAIELKLVNRIRATLAEWRPLALKGQGGVTRTTHGADAPLAQGRSAIPALLRPVGVRRDDHLSHRGKAGLPAGDQCAHGRTRARRAG